MAHGNGSRSAEQGGHGDYDKPQGCFLRVFWMAIGNIALLAIAWFILAQRRFSLLDVAYWAVVALVVGARHLDIARYGGSTVSGTPATAQDFRRYALVMLLAAAVLWAATHALGLVF